MEINSSTPINELINIIVLNERRRSEGHNDVEGYYAACAEIRKRSYKATKFDMLVKRLYERFLLINQWIEVEETSLGDIVELHAPDGVVSSISGQITPESLADFLAGE